MKFKDVLRSLRIECGWTQEELGSRIGASKSAVANWETGLRVPKADKLEEIADLFNVDLDYLLGKTTKTTRLARIYSDEESDRMSKYMNYLKNVDLRNLLDSAHGCKREDIEMVIDLLNRMKK